MKSKFFGGILSMGILIGGCSQVPEIRRVTASLDDVGVIGPDGSTTLFYKSNEHIFVLDCSPNTPLGLTPDEARANCSGRPNKVPVERFKQAIKDLVSTKHLNALKPLSPNEVEIYAEGGPSSEEISAMEIELQEINKFISVYGAGNGNVVRQEELRKALKSSEAFASVVKKIDDEIEKTIKLIIDGTKLTLSKFDPDKDQFLYAVLKNFNPTYKAPCGNHRLDSRDSFHQSIERRIFDCASQPTSTKKGFVLVTRTHEFREIYKDIKTGLLWGDILPKDDHYDASDNTGSTTNGCDQGMSFRGGKQPFPERGALPESTKKSWRLPIVKEFKEAFKNGIGEALPNMNNYFWSQNDEGYYRAWLIDGRTGKEKLVDRMFSIEHYRCVLPTKVDPR